MKIWFFEEKQEKLDLLKLRCRKKKKKKKKKKKSFFVLNKVEKRRKTEKLNIAISNLRWTGLSNVKNRGKAEKCWQKS